MKYELGTATGPLKVVVVDDDRTNRLWTSRLVTQCGHVPLAVQSGQDAVHLCEDQDVDVVLMDILMPGMSGFDAARAIKTLYSERWVPIVFLSGLNEEGARDNWTELGDDFMPKPVDPQLLTAKLRSLSVAVGHERALRRFAQQMESEQMLARKLIDKMGFQFNRVEWPWLSVFNTEAGIGSGDCLAVEKHGSHVFMLVADATGHGLAAAVSLIPAISVFRAMVAKGFGVAEMADEINLKLRDMLPRDRFVAATLVDIDCATQTIAVLNAGMPPGGLVSAMGGVLVDFASACPPLGVNGRLPYARAVVRQPLEKGQYLLFYSDGFSEVFHTMPVRNQVMPLQAGETVGAAGLKLWEECLKRSPQDDAMLVCVDLDGLLLPVVSEGFVRLTARRLRAGSIGAGDVLDMLAVQGWANVQHNTKLVVVLSELLANAIEHGVLGLGSALKEMPNGLELYEQERRKRLAQLESGWVEVRLRSVAGEPMLELELADSGDGFDVHEPPEGDTPLADINGLSGRGLSLLSHLCESVRYDFGGSRVTVRIAVDELF